MKYKMAIFDMDGTILDTLEDLTICTNYALSKNGLEKRTVNEVKQFVGNGIKKQIERACGENVPEDIVQKVYNDYNTYYKIHSNDNTKAYDGIGNLLKRLKENNVITAVVSNKSDYAVQPLVKIYFDGLFDYAFGLTDKTRAKPYPDSVNYIIQKFGIDKKDCVYIGDSEVDVKTAQNSEVDCLAVSWGFRSIDILKNAGAKIIVDTPEELYNELL